MIERMMAGKGAGNKFATLAARELVSVQVAHLKTRFELAEKSVLAEKAVQMVNQAFDLYEAQEGPIRVKPGEMVVEHHGEALILPLLEARWLGHEMGVLEARRHHEHDQYSRLVAKDPEATYGELWRLLGRTEQTRGRAPRDYDFLPEEPLSHESLSQYPRRPEDLASVPERVMKPVSDALVNGYGCKMAQAEAMIKAIAGIRAWCCPPLKELRPGQVVWLARGTRKSRKSDPQLFVPVVLTLMAPGEQEVSVRHRGEYKELKLRQIERMTTEAWRQDGVLTNLDVEWLTGLAPTTIRELLEAYQERFGIILPTAGTVLDMGRTLTHKKLVVEMALGGIPPQTSCRRRERGTCTRSAAPSFAGRSGRRPTDHHLYRFILHRQPPILPATRPPGASAVAPWALTLP